MSHRTTDPRQNDTANEVPPPAAVPHPAWCQPAWCDVEWFLLTDGDQVLTGEHWRATSSPQRTGDGRDLMLGLAAEPADEPQGLRVALVLAANEDDAGVTEVNRWRRGDRVHLEPEEARLLARHLVEAADEWDRVRSPR